MSTELTKTQPAPPAMIDPGMMELINRAATDKDFDVAKLHSLLDFQERLMDRSAEQAFFRDFAAALKKMPHVAKRGSIKIQGGIAYATYDDIDAAVRRVEDEHGFSRSFLRDGTNMVLLLAHRDGHTLRSVRPIAPDKGPGRNDTQAEGSGASYAKRYLTKDLWNIRTDGEDDDGKMAGAISEEQLAEIESLIEQIPGFDSAKFLKTYGVGSLAEIQHYQFNEVVTLLKEGVRRRK